MATLGFTYYNEISQPAEPTLQDIINSLTGIQKSAVLDGFTNKILPGRLKYTIAIPERAIQRLYNAIDSIEETARAIMREEVVLVEGTYDEDGNEITPPEYNVAPDTPAELLADVALNFADIFTEAQVSAVLQRMVEYSRVDSSGDPIGDWAYYSTNVVL